MSTNNSKKPFNQLNQEERTSQIAELMERCLEILNQEEDPSLSWSNSLYDDEEGGPNNLNEDEDGNEYPANQEDSELLQETKEELWNCLTSGNFLLKFQDYDLNEIAKKTGTSELLNSAINKPRYKPDETMHPEEVQQESTAKGYHRD